MRKIFRFLAMIGGLAVCGAGANDAIVHLENPALGGVLDDAGTGTPVVLIIPGSGPTDHDGNSPFGVEAQPYRLLAIALAQRGITTVRIDKRGMFLSKSPDIDPNKVTLEIYANDVRIWVDHLRQVRRRNCIWLLGHSEGSQVAEVAAASQASPICGLILASAPGRPGAAILSEQLHIRLHGSSLESYLPKIDTDIRALSAGLPIINADLPVPLQSLFRPEVQGFLTNWFSHDPRTDLARSTVPALILEGTTDHQVPAADGARLASARKGTALALIEGMNHLWKPSSSNVTKDLASYTNSRTDIEPAMVEAIVDFIHSNEAGSPPKVAPR